MSKSDDHNKAAQLQADFEKRYAERVAKKKENPNQTQPFRGNCPNCRTAVNLGDAFCSECGAQIDISSFSPRQVKVNFNTTYDELVDPNKGNIVTRFENGRYVKERVSDVPES